MEVPASGQTRPVELAEGMEQVWNGGKSHSAFSEELSKRQIRLPSRKANRNGRRPVTRSPSFSFTDGRRRNEPPPTASTSCRANCSDTDVGCYKAYLFFSLDVSAPTKPEDGDPDPLHVEGVRTESEMSSSVQPQKTETLGKEPEQKKQEGGGDASIAQGVYGLNMFLARWAFDLARNPDFEEKFRQAILKKLSGLRRPNYVTPLTLCELDLGSNFPEIRNLRSLPSQGTIVCPELLVDISYAGGLEMTVETYVDPREGATWGRLDRALSNLQGNQTHEKMQDENADLYQDLPDEIPEALSDSGTLLSEADGRDQLSNGTSSEKQLSGFSMRKFAAAKAKQLAERVAESISKIPLRLSVKVVKLEGTMLVWIAPPPSERLWISFIQTPTIEITAKPILAHRALKYYAVLTRVSSWLQRKIKQSFCSNLVFPNCTNLSFPGLMGLKDEYGLRHPTLAVMNDLTCVSECESEFSDSETRPSPLPASRAPVDSTASVEEVYFLPPGHPATSAGLEGTEEKDRARNVPLLELPKDERLDAIRQNRFDTHRLNTFRRTWEGQDLLDEHVPSRESHGRRIVKRCVSLSDGDISQGESEDDEQEYVMSDCIEFFDPESTTPICSSSSTSEEEPISSVAATAQDNSPVQEIPWPASLPDQSSHSTEKSESSVRSPARRLGSRLGYLVRNVQTAAAEEIDAALKRRAANQASSSSNNLIRAAKQRAGEKVKDALENRTAQLKNSGLKKIWGPRKNT